MLCCWFLGHCLPKDRPNTPWTTTFALDHEDWNKLFILLHLARSKNWKLYIWINAFVLSPSLLLWTTGWHSTLLSGRKRLTTLHSDFSSVSAKYHGSRGNIEEYWSNQCKQRWIILFLPTFKLISNLPFSPQYLADTGKRYKTQSILGHGQASKKRCKVRWACTKSSELPKNRQMIFDC